jgi:hypothetical protein
VRSKLKPNHIKHLISLIINFNNSSVKLIPLCRTIDSLAVGYGKGKLTFFLCDVEAIVDLVS